MYNRTIATLLVGILLATSPLLAEADGNLITVNNPVANQILTPGQQVIVKYTVNGVPQSE